MTHTTLVWLSASVTPHS